MCMICGVNQANAAAAEAAGASYSAMLTRYVASGTLETADIGTLEGTTDLWAEARVGDVQLSVATGPASRPDDADGPILASGAAGADITSPPEWMFTTNGYMGSLPDQAGGSNEAMTGSQTARLNQTNAGSWFEFSGDLDIDAVLIGSEWTISTLTFSFPTSGAEYGGSYYDPDFPANHIDFNPAQVTAARQAIDMIESYTQLTINETTDPGANLRFSQTDDDTSLPSAQANFPTGFPASGDVWFGSNNQPFYLTPEPGNWGYATLLHELGHAMGLKHGHQDYTAYDLTSDNTLSGPGPRFGSRALTTGPGGHDGQAWSLMTYSATPSSGPGFYGDQFNQPQTYMQNDIAALQYMYGANFTYNGSNTTYTFDANGVMSINGAPQTAPDGTIILRTIWDGNGVDTYDFTNFSNNQTINLAPGAFSTFSTAQLANHLALSSGSAPAPGNVANALLFRGTQETGLGEGDLRSLIENAWVGAGADTVIGNVANNDIDGNGGNDTLDGGEGDDTIQGGANNDSITGGAVDNDKLYGEAGNDTIDAGHGSDTVDGGDNADSLLGSDGSDSVEGGAGNDTIDGGLQNDTLRGGTGADSIIGGGLDNDEIHGDGGADTIDAGMGADKLWGEDDGDSLKGGDGDDTIDAGAGADTVLGGAGADKILGGSIDDDTLSGEAGADTVDAGAGDDYVDGGEDNDSLLGGVGADYIHGGSGFGADTLDGGGGADTITGGLGDDTYIWNGSGVILENASEGVDKVQLFTGAIESTFASIYIENFDVMVTTGVVVWGNDFVDGSGNSNIMTSGAGNDWFYGKGGKDTLLGNAGNDRLDGGAGADSMNGGADNDTYVIDDAGDTINDSSGNDTIEVNTTGIDLAGANIIGSIENVGLGEAAGAATLYGDEEANGLSGNSFANDIFGRDGADTIDGKGGHDEIYAGELASGVDVGDSVQGGTGNDTIYGARGNDTLWAGDGQDSVFGGADNDSIDGNLGNDQVYGEAGNDTLIGGALDADRLDGGDGNDSADGGTGADTLVTGAGADTLIGGGDNDVLVASNGNISGASRSNISGGAGDDLLLLDWSATNEQFWSVALTTTADGNSGKFYWQPNENDGAHNRTDFTGIDRFDITLGSSADRIVTGAGRDTIDAGAGADTIWSGSGADDIDGGNNGAGTADVWIADLSASSANITLNLLVASSNFQVGADTGSVEDVEQLGINDGTNVFKTGSGADTITTRGGFFHDNISTGLGDDRVKVAGGRDLVALGGQASTAGDVLEVDWSTVNEEFESSWLAADTLNGTGYSGKLYWEPNENDGNHNRVDFSGVERFKISTGGIGDELVTGDGIDTVNSGGGADIIWSGKGADSIDGGGNDAGTADVWIADLSDATANLTINLAGSSSTFQVGAATGSVTDIEQLGRNADFVFNTGSGDDNLTTLSGFFNDYISTGLGNDTLTMAGGRDLVLLGGQSTVAGDLLVVDWSAGPNDRYSTSSWSSGAEGYAGDLHWTDNANDTNHFRTQFSGVERFHLRTAGGDDNLRTGDGADSVNSGGGNDIIRSGAGADTIDGGANTLNGEGNPTGPDTWVADKSATTANTTIDLTGGTSTYMIGAVQGSVTGIERLGFDWSEAFSIGSGNDTIITLSGFYTDHILTNDGRDTVKVAGGRDRVLMGGQTGVGDLLEVDWSGVHEEFESSWLTPDTVGGTGYSGDLYWEPNLNDGVHNRVLFDGVERFKFTFGDASDELVTGDNADTVSSGGGADWIWSGAGLDVIDAGAGSADVWMADKSASTTNMIIDLTALSSTYKLTGAGAEATVSGVEQLGHNNGDIRYRFATGSGHDTVVSLGGFFHDWIATHDGADTVKVAGGRDLVQMGGQTGMGDLLIVDWSVPGEDYSSVALTTEGGGTGYTGKFFWVHNENDGAHNRVDFSGVERFNITTGGGIDRIWTGDNADTVISGGGQDRIWSGTGADIIDGGANDAAAPDIWMADKSAATTNMVINLTGGVSTYMIGASQGSVTGVEQLGHLDGTLANRFITGSGDDTITTLGGFFHDWIVTNAGSDTVKVAGGRDAVEMGDETAAGDVLIIDWSAHATDRFHSNAPTLDAALGYSGKFYWADNENDGAHNRLDYSGVERFNISTGGGSDIIRTGDNADTVSGAGGQDLFFTGAGLDNVSGGSNDAAFPDVWTANKSAGTTAFVANLAAASFTYTLVGAGPSATVSGIEQLGINDGTNVFSTGSGDDVLTTLDGFFHDWMSTNAGADTVKVAGGRDVVQMGAQSGLGDLLIVDWSAHATDRFHSAALTTEGGGTGYSGKFYWADNENDGAHNRVDFSGVERFNVATGGGADIITTGDAADTLSGNGGNDTLISGKGADVVQAGTGEDKWVADKSNATSAQAIVLNFQLTTAQAYMDTGSVRGIDWVDLQTGAGADELITTELFLHDFVATNGGADTVSIFAGRDTVHLGDQGGGTSDVLVIDWSSTNDAFQTNALDKPNNTGYVGRIGWRSNENDGAHNRVDYSGVEIFDITLGGGADVITTGDGADSLRGGMGDDVLNSGRGDDFIDAGAGNDHWIADKFYATVDIEINLQKVGFSTYLTTGAVRGVESMQFVSGSGADKLTTGLSFLNDHITTRAGNDIVTVAGGRDYVEMGAAGGKGDRLIVDWSASGDEFQMSALGSDATGHSGVLFWKWNSNDGAHNRVDFVGVERFNVKLGTAGDNVTTGDGADTVAGGAGNDTLGGGAGNDRLFGGDGVDNVNGGDGGDILDGGLGQDFLTGGLGADTFAYTGVADSATGARDVITDLDDVLDRIDLSKIDANTLIADDQKFTKVAAFTGNAGQLVVSPYDSINNWTLIQGDVDGDGLADFAIQVTGDHDTFNRFVL